MVIGVKSVVKHFGTEKIIKQNFVQQGVGCLIVGKTKNILTGESVSENTLNLIAFTKILWISAFSLLYSSGGISGKWKRRWLGSAWMMIGILIVALFVNHTFQWRMLLYFPLMVGALSLGYGVRE